MPLLLHLEPPLLISVRFMLSFLGFLLTAIQYMQRTNISVGIVCMINNTRLEELALSSPGPHSNQTNKHVGLLANSSQVQEQCAFQKVEKSSRRDGPFAWNKSIQGLVLSSFFYGYLLTQVEQQNKLNLLFATIFFTSFLYSN